jgi:hypothetical protein
MDDLDPVVFDEAKSTGDRFLIYGTDLGLQIDVQCQGETLWLTQAQIAELLGVPAPMIDAHLDAIYQEGELEQRPTSKESLPVQTEGECNAVVHNLDAVIAVGYRVSSKKAALFRRWATETLTQFAMKGFVVDSARMKQAGSADRAGELRDIIRDIRADEANVYRELRAICAMCRDYDKTSSAWREFYRATQSKLLYAATSCTPAEVIASRANAEAPNMGLTNWPKDAIRKQDVTVSKRYLTEAEIKELNRLTTMLLDIFEDQLDMGRLIVMDDVRALLDRLLASLNRSLLPDGEGLKSADARKYAEQQYEFYNARRKAERHADADRLIAVLLRG